MSGGLTLRKELNFFPKKKVAVFISVSFGYLQKGGSLLGKRKGEKKKSERLTSILRVGGGKKRLPQQGTLAVTKAPWDPVYAKLF